MREDTSTGRNVRSAWSSCLAALAFAMPAHAATITDHTVVRPEGARHYLIVEAGGRPQAKRPLLIVLHGHGGSAAMMAGLASMGGYRSRAWAELAAREDILLIAPDGVQGSDGRSAWNDCRRDAATNATTDDTGFIAALIDAAIAQHGADPQRVYVFGVSNGGGMAYRVGIELADRVAAIGVQSGLMAENSACAPPSRPLSVFLAHGTADPITPYAGGRVGSWLLRGRGSVVGAEQTAAMWRQLAGLPDMPQVVRFPHLRPEDRTSATRIVWGADPAGLQVALLRIDGGGHVEASRQGELPWLLRQLVGEMNHDVDTVEEAWSFFKAKRKAAGQ